MRGSSSARKLSNRSREHEASTVGEKASSLPPRRRERHGASREPRRGVNFAPRDIEELVKTSKIVPVDGHFVHSDMALTRGGNASARMRKNSVDSASTMAPGSNQTSPMLGFEASTWPSLRQASAPDWDFCSEEPDDDDDDDLWQDLPEPAVSLEDLPTSEESPKEFDPSPATHNRWCYVPAGGCVPPPTPSQQEVAQVSEVIAANSKPSFADVVRDQSNDQAGHVLPPAPGTMMPKFHARPVQRRNGGTSTEHDGDEYNADLDLDFVSRHFWTKDHKESWNTKARLKREQQEAGRHAQRVETSKDSGDEEDAEDQLED